MGKRLPMGGLAQRQHPPGISGRALRGEAFGQRLLGQVRDTTDSGDGVPLDMASKAEQGHPRLRQYPARPVGLGNPEPCGLCWK